MKKALPLFDVMLLGQPYQAAARFQPVGPDATGYVKITSAEGNVLPIAVDYSYGAVVEDSRQQAEAVLRSFERNDGKFAFYPTRYYSMFDPARATTPPPAGHYNQPEPEWSLDEISNGTYKVEAYCIEKRPSLALLNSQGELVFEVVDRELMRDIIVRHNALETRHFEKINADNSGFEFTSLVEV